MNRAMFPSVVFLLLAAGCDPKVEQRPGTDSDTGEDTDETTVTDADGDGVPAEEDCDDTDASISPSAPEVCNGIDDDCDDLIDDADDSLDLSTAETFYADLDGDGYGDTLAAAQACVLPSGFTDIAGDCLDSDASISPAAAEVCNGTDDDCDDLIDDADDSLDLSTTDPYYADSDGDGYGDPDTLVEVCSPSSAYVVDATDCNDRDAQIFPGAAEACNGTDDDCDPSTGEDGTISVGGRAFVDLEAALAFAGSGDTVTLCDGVYTGSFVLPDGATLTSFNGASVTTLQGDGLGTAAILTADGAADILDLTFRDGFALLGGAIDAYSGTIGGDVSVYNSTFEDNVAGYGGAILANLDHTLTVVDSEFRNNTAGVTDSTSYYGSGGAIYAAALDVQGCTFEGNTGYFGGALYIQGEAVLDSSTVITTNSAVSYSSSESGYGGGFFGRDATITLDGVEISSNTADYFGGGGLTFTSDVSGGEFTDNTASVTGGGLYFYTDTAHTLEDATFANNDATNAGGVMFDGASGAGILTGTDLLFETNYATTAGGGAWMLGAIVELTDVVFDANESAERGGAAYVGGSGTDEEVLLICDSVEAYDNVAVDGGGFMVDSSELELSGGLVTGNSASGDGGGAYLSASLLTSDVVDWDGTGSDNSPDDVYIDDAAASYDAFGTSESFECDASTCE